MSSSASPPPSGALLGASSSVAPLIPPTVSHSPVAGATASNVNGIVSSSNSRGHSTSHPSTDAFTPNYFGGIGENQEEEWVDFDHQEGQTDENSINQSTQSRESRDPQQQERQILQHQTTAMSEGTGKGTGTVTRAIVKPSRHEPNISAVQHVRKQVAKQNYVKKSDTYWNERALKPGRILDWKFVFAMAFAGNACSAFAFSYAFDISGIYGMLISLCLEAVSYLCLSLCLAEMSSAFPFCGGSYGFTRALLGRPAGQIVGLAESMEWILNASTFASLGISPVLTVFFDTDPQLEGIWITLSYLWALTFNILGCTWAYAFYSLNFLVVITYGSFYLFGMMKYGDWNNAGYAAGAVDTDGVTPIPLYYVTGFAGIMKGLPWAVYMLIGPEAAAMTAEEVVDPKTNVPKGLVGGTFCSVLLIVCIVIAGIAAPQIAYGDTVINLFTTTDGYQIIFNSVTADPRFVMIVPVISYFTFFFSAHYAWGRQIFAMARSGHLPHFLSWTLKSRGTPVAALVAGTLLSWAAAMFSRYAPASYKSDVSTVVFNLGICGSLISYIFQGISFIILRVQYGAVVRKFKSPIGIAGAVYMIVLYTAALIGLFMVSTLLWQSVLALFCWLGLGMAYYYFYARYHLLMSPEEYRSMFVLYSIQFIRAKNRAATHKGRKTKANNPAADAEVKASIAAAEKSRVGDGDEDGDGNGERNGDRNGDGNARKGKEKGKDTVEKIESTQDKTSYHTSYNLHTIGKEDNIDTTKREREGERGPISPDRASDRSSEGNISSSAAAAGAGASPLLTRSTAAPPSLPVSSSLHLPAARYRESDTSEMKVLEEEEEEEKTALKRPRKSGGRSRERENQLYPLNTPVD